jgi:LacI family transcriptional regulator
MSVSQKLKLGVGLWLNSEYGHRVFYGIIEHIKSAPHIEVTTMSAEELPRKGKEMAAELDGLIAVLDTNEIWRIQDYHIPKVLVPRLFSELDGIVTVATDGFMLGALAAEHLLACGANRLTIGPTVVDVLGGNDLNAGFRAVTEKAGARLDFVPVGWNDRAKHSEIVDWIRHQPCPFGLAVFHDSGAKRAVQLIHEAGYRVPEDVAVMGLNDEKLISMTFQPTLTSVGLAAERIGRLAAETMERLCRGEKAASIRVPPLGIDARQSTSAVYLQDNLVASALQYIHAKVMEPMDATKIARYLGVSRVTLHKHFFKARGHGVPDEINTYRLNRATHMLVNTNASFKEIGYAIGMPIPSIFTRFIKQQTGLTPRRYRQKNRKS